MKNETQMTKTDGRSFLTALFGVAVLLGATPASAQYLNLTPTVVDDVPAAANHQADPFNTPRPSLFKPFTDVLGDFRHLPSRTNAQFLVVGLVAAAGVHKADGDVTEDFGGTRNGLFRPGATIGGTPVELGAAFATYAIARSMNKPGVMSLGSDLIRAQVMAEILTVGIKQGTRRARPEGSGFSFPSGHTSAAFASATVIQQHYGWKFGVPAYAVATYVAASRVEMKKHYLSDVAFGAAIGIMAGRTVTIGHQHKFALTPISSTDGTGVGAGLTWVGRK
jgi:membrane-associated phospholipid phosphatase